MIILAQVDFNTLREALKPKDPSAIDLSKDLTLGGIISALLPYLFVIAGLILLLYLIWGGFSLMTSAGDPKKMEAAKGKVTNAVVGFIIIFISFWLMQLLQVVFGLPKIF